MLLLRRISFSLFLPILILSACNFFLASDVTPPPASAPSLAERIGPIAELSPAAEKSSVASTQQTGPAADSISTSQIPSAARSVVITGKVTNLSGGKVPAGLEAVLQLYTAMEKTDTKTTQLREDATFEFAPIDVMEGQVILVTVDYEGITFPSEMIETSLLVQDGTQRMDVNIYDTTSDLANVLIDRAHTFITFPTPEKMQVIVYLLVSNTGQKVVTTTDGKPVLTFSVPPGASNLVLDDAGMNSRFIPLENGFGDTMSILPGMQKNEILYSFDLPYDGRQDVTLAFPIETKGGSLVVPKELQIRGEGLIDAGEREMNTRVVHLYNFEKLKGGQPLEFELSGKVKTVTGTSPGTLILIGTGAFTLVLLSSGYWLWRKSKTRAENNPVIVETVLPMTQEAVLDAIIALDQDYENGSIGEEEYSHRREQLKRTLQKLRG